MSNISGKAYAMNVITPLRFWTAIWQKFIFWFVVFTYPRFLKGLINLSLIHYARWTMIGRNEFPRLDESQPEEDLHYSYMLFESNFNGSWDQYIDSFSFAIPEGLDIFWAFNIKYPKSIPLHDFYDYIRFNQVETDHYYIAYPYASANDVKHAELLADDLISLQEQMDNLSDEEFGKMYDKLLSKNQFALGALEPSPVVSLAHFNQQQAGN